MTSLITREGLKSRGISYSNVHLIRLENAGRFPRRVTLSRTRVAWAADEIESWLKDLIAERDAKVDTDDGGR
jgi:prophage regulatory protein